LKFFKFNIVANLPSFPTSSPVERGPPFPSSKGLSTDCRPNLRPPLRHFLKRKIIMARRNKPPMTPPTAAPATVAFPVGAGPLLPLLGLPEESSVCPGTLGLAVVPDGLDPGIDVTDEPDVTIEIANGESILDVTALELVAMDDAAIGKKESLAAGSGEPVETGCCDR
jgi:hypothetical protein